MQLEIRRARQLRSNMSTPEIILWSRLKPLKARGFHIRVIEVDGWQHGDERQREHDAVRDRILKRHGFRVLRFWASDVRNDLDWVMDQVVMALDAAPEHKPRAA